MASLITRERVLILLANLTYIVGFTIWFLMQGNTEFLWYVVVMIGLLIFIAHSLSYSRLPNTLLILLSIWGFMHMAGGGVVVNGEVLYRFVFAPVFDGGGDFVLFKFDQLVHVFGFGVAAGCIHWLIRSRAPSVRPIWRGLLAALTAMGLGVVNEIVEFAAFLALSETGVGGFYNLQLDLVFNTLGAAIAVVGLEIYLRLKRGR
jgi:hypothetical protein